MGQAQTFVFLPFGSEAIKSPQSTTYNFLSMDENKDSGRGS